MLEESGLYKDICRVWPLCGPAAFVGMTNVKWMVVCVCVLYTHDLAGVVWRRSTLSTDGQVSVCNVWLSEDTSK